MQPASLTTELLTAQVRISRRPLTWAGRCVGCSWIQLDFAGLHGQNWAIARRGGEVIREVGQCQLQRGAPAVLLNHAVQLQLGGPVEHLTPICARKAAGFRKGRPWMCDSVSRGRSYHDQHLGYQSLIAWTSSAQQLVITKPTCTWKTARLN